MNKETRDWLIGDTRQLVFMAVGAGAGTLLGVVLLDGRPNIISAAVICMVLGQFLNMYLRYRERKRTNGDAE